MNAQTPAPLARRMRQERGSVLVQVAVACIVLIAFAMFVIDQGLMFVSRRQAQNAADAGALAGAIALSFDDFHNRSNSGPAKQSARGLAVAHPVAGQAPSVDITTDVYFYNDDPSKFPAECDDDGCVRVDVYRNQARSNPLPTWFGGLVGVSNQGVRATATARAAAGNATDCLKPWAVVDKWEERYPTPAPWTTDSRFDKYHSTGSQATRGTIDPSIDPPDYYQAPTSTDPGTGFRPYNADMSYSSDYGRQMWLKVGGENDFEFGSGWFMALQLTTSGGATYKDNIKNCIGTIYAIGDTLEYTTEPGEKVGPTRQGVETDADSLVNQDPTAKWDPAANGGHGGVVDSAFSVSPRIVPVPVINPDHLMEAQKGGRTSVPIANIVGFFVEGYENKGVRGRLVAMPGMTVSRGSNLNPQSSFIKVIQLVR